MLCVEPIYLWAIFVELIPFSYTASSFRLCVDNLLHVLKQEEDQGPMIEEEEDDGGSTSENEIISMCCNNLVQA
jgi:hypothetical protein